MTTNTVWTIVDREPRMTTLTVWTIRDGEPRTTTSSLTQFLSSDGQIPWQIPG